jgi:hypothetical protein
VTLSLWRSLAASSVNRVPPPAHRHEHRRAWSQPHSSHGSVSNSRCNASPPPPGQRGAGTAPYSHALAGVPSSVDPRALSPEHRVEPHPVAVPPRHAGGGNPGMRRCCWVPPPEQRAERRRLVADAVRAAGDSYGGCAVSGLCAASCRAPRRCGRTSALSAHLPRARHTERAASGRACSCVAPWRASRWKALSSKLECFFRLRREL